MMSDNYLFEDWRCPICHSHGPFSITTKHGKGVEEHERAVLKDDNVCVCRMCSHSATVADFLPLPAERQSNRFLRAS